MQRLQAQLVWNHVAERPARGADKVMVGDCRVRVVALRPGPRRHFEHLAHRDQLVQGVVDRREADLGEPLLCGGVYRLGGEMDVLAGQYLGDDAPLRRHSPLAVSQSL